VPFYESPDLTINIVKVFGLGAMSFIAAFLWTPFLTNILYKYKLWRKDVRTKSIDGKELEYFQKFHAEGETHTPRFGGMLIWITTLVFAGGFYLISILFDSFWAGKFNFLSRGQTWIPLFTLVAASVIGFIDDFLQVRGKGGYIAGGLPLNRRILAVFLIGLVGAWWFYEKLERSSIFIPLVGDIDIGILYPIIFIITMIATYSGGVIDGIDGLAGGVFAGMFGAFGAIALFEGQIDLATFCAVILGSLLAFLWYNIPPARFYFGETGILGLTTTLSVVAFLTDSLVVLPIIGFLLVAESASVILQLIWKKWKKRKLFLAAPIHHHFEAKGWPPYKVTMRFWVIGTVMAIIGLVIRLIG
jgi:phospho-N-acetylmuramoyl-pentapeptide-transferase